MNLALPLDGVRILVAEDEFFVSELIVDALQSFGADVVVSVSRVDKLIQTVVDNPPDAATLDINLRGEYVYPALPILRKRQIPFIFVTAYKELPGCPENTEAVPRVAKPFQARKLADTLAHAIRRQNDMSSN
jgi:CheY-like chemotaxis protein